MAERDDEDKLDLGEVKRPKGPLGLGIVKFGKDQKLEEDADKLLKGSAGENKRSIARDIEKVRYEHGLATLDELEHYDPADDWNAKDSAFAVLTDPSDISSVESTICDENIRARNPQLQERQALMRHVSDSDSWGSAWEAEIPPLGDNGDRKRCSKCDRYKSLDHFSPDRRGRYGRDNWCKSCRMGQKRDKRDEKSVR